MSWQEYSLGLVDALAWPGAVLILGMLFYRPLRAISRRVQDDLAAGKALQIGTGRVLVGINERDDYRAQWHKPYTINVATTPHTDDDVGLTPTSGDPASNAPDPTPLTGATNPGQPPKP